jgi:hypothetical protein
VARIIIIPTFFVKLFFKNFLGINEIIGASALNILAKNVLFLIPMTHIFEIKLLFNR